MYDLPEYKEPSLDVLHAFMHQHPFAFICGSGAGGRPVATQIPVFTRHHEGKLFLVGHIMRNTDHHEAFVGNPSALAVFTGSSTYVSASWYTDKKTGSTWNYMSVHAAGTLRFTDHDGLLRILQMTTDHFEANPESGSNYKDLPEEYVASLSKAIVGFEIEVDSLRHVFKLSQDRDRESYRNITEHLEQRGGDSADIAGQMKIREERLFDPND